MSNKLFSLKWTNHSEHIVNTFADLRAKDEFTDVTLACDGKKIKAHKMLLAACSDYFKEMFFENPCKHPVVILKNVIFEDLDSIVTFMYNGQVNVCQDRLGTFLETADLLQVKGLQNENKTTTSPTHASASTSSNSSTQRSQPSPVKQSTIVPEFNADLNGIPESEYYISRQSEVQEKRQRRRIVPKHVIRKRNNTHLKSEPSPSELSEMPVLEPTVKQGRFSNSPWSPTTSSVNTSAMTNFDDESDSQQQYSCTALAVCDPSDDMSSEVKYEYEDVYLIEDDSNEIPEVLPEAIDQEEEESSSYALALIGDEEDTENHHEKPSGCYEALEPVSIVRDLSEYNGTDPVATMIATKRGFKINFENSLYTRDKVHLEKEYWRCVNTNKYKCKGRLILIDQKIHAAKPHNTTCLTAHRQLDESNIDEDSNFL